jgi:hypothetical protein
MFWYSPSAYACMNELAAAEQSRNLAALGAFALVAGLGVVSALVTGVVVYRRLRPSPLA